MKRAQHRNGIPFEKNSNAHTSSITRFNGRRNERFVFVFTKTNFSTRTKLSKRTFFFFINFFKQLILTFEQYIIYSLDLFFYTSKTQGGGEEKTRCYKTPIPILMFILNIFIFYTSCIQSLF